MSDGMAAVFVTLSEMTSRDEAHWSPDDLDEEDS